VLARRTRLAQELPDRGAAIAPRVAAILGTALGWDADRQAAEVAAYLEGAERQYGVPELARAPATEPAPAFEAAR
jgi:glycerol-3-phosphate dehydrogenase